MEPRQRLHDRPVVPSATGLVHHTVMTVVEGDFYEDDEPLEKILAIWESSPKILTGPPPEERPSVIVLDRDVYTMSQAARMLGLHPATPPGMTW